MPKLSATPPKSWDKFQQFWYPSDLSPHFYQAKINVGQGITLCVEAGGNPDNPPLLFITGFGSQMMFWSDKFLKKLMDMGFFVIRFDNRDTGLSTKIHHLHKLPHTNILKMIAKNHVGLSNAQEKVAYKLTDMADDVAGLIYAMNLGKTNIVGASMGGLIAQILCAKYPYYIDKLVLLFSSTNHPFLRLPKPKQFSTFFKKAQSNSEKDMLRHAVWFMTAVGSPGHLDIKGTREIASIRYQRCHNPLGMAQQMNAILATGSIFEYTKRITAPTLIIHGNKDGLLHQNHGKHIAKHIKNSQLVIVDGLAHDLPAYYQPYLTNLISKHCLPNHTKI
ncbi:alpha/beta fold hydrolase [Moraxella oblonga]|uniref:alpha/beta fold hydrolase n=1 Tax=Moraxella oblonga TaxID=200413 RepID=UPI00083700F3|nr:alpha/beta hydrolase [Moraxella oblonga]